MLEQMRLIGFVLLVPFTAEQDSYRAFLAASRLPEMQPSVLTLDPHLCERLPSDEFLAYDLLAGKEPLIRYTGDLMLFKSLEHARSIHSYEMAAGRSSTIVGLSVFPASPSHGCFVPYLRREYGEDYARTFYSESRCEESMIQWLGYDAADLQGISVLWSRYPGWPDVSVNQHGLLDDVPEAVTWCGLGNRHWREAGGGHGPFIEWRLGLVDAGDIRAR